MSLKNNLAKQINNANLTAIEYLKTKGYKIEQLKNHLNLLIKQ